MMVKVFLACSRLSVSGGLKKRAGDEWCLVGKKERSGEPVSIVLKTLYQLLVYPLIGYAPINVKPLGREAGQRRGI